MINRHGGIITKICFYYAKNSDDFSDLRQDVLAAIWQSRDSFRHDAAESTWVYRLALNTCISSFRRRRRASDTLPIDLISEPADESDVKTARRNELYTLISRLNAREKALILMWLDDMSYDQISEITGATRNTIATRLRRAKQKLIEISNS